MKKHHNTLYVTTQGAYLAAEGETVVVKAEGVEKMKIPLHMLEGIVCFGQVSCSPFLMGRCGEKGVSISFLSQRGRFLARVEGPVSGNVTLRRAQYRAADDLARSAQLARTFVLAKVANSRTVVLRACRDHPNSPGVVELRRTADALARLIKRLGETGDLNQIRGLEGEAARRYFGVFNHLIVSQKDAFSFRGRTRRPPLDAVNAILSFLYTLLVHDGIGALQSVGLDPQVGFLHRDRPGRPGLALDLAEEFRAMIADRVALALINRKQVDNKGFTTTETGGVLAEDDARKTILVAYQERKAEEIKHRFLDETTTVGTLMHLQALMLSRHIRGELDAYPPFFWR